MKKLLVVTAVLAAGVATTFGANTWTLEDQTSPWILPDDALTGCLSGNNNMSNLKIGDNQAFNQNYSYEWSFADPKDITSVQLFFAGPSVAVNSISVLCEGAEEYVEVEGSARAQADIGASKYALFAADNGPFATRVIGLKVNIGSANYSHNNGQEILVCGHNSDGVFNWQAGFFDPEGYSRAADDLKAGFAMTGSDSWSNPRANFIDGNPSTVSYLSGGSTIPFAFETPKRIRRVCLHNAKYEGGFDIEGIYVKYNGSDEFVRLPNTGLGYFNASANWCVEFNGEGFFARDVIGLQIKFGSCNNVWRFSVGEVEVDGADSFVSTLDADYLVSGGKLNTKLTGVASEYPKAIYICTGEVDGGTDVSQWDNVVKVGELADAETPVVDSRIVDFKFCRFYFQDVDNDAWSEPFELVLEPSATAQVTERRSADAKIETVIDCCGGTNEVAAVYFAYAQKGEELPAYTLVETNVPTGKTVSVKVTGLTSLATYAYQVKVVNVDGGELVIPGEFDSRGQCYWEKTSFVPADWTSPEDRIPCRASPLYDNRVLRDQGQGNLNSNSVITCSWTEPKDIETIEVYTYGDRSWRLELLNVQVKFDGDEDYTLLTGSHLNYTENPGTGVKLAVLHGSDGLVAQKVTSVKIQSGHWANGHASGIGELVFRGKTSGSEVKWDYRAVASADGFALPDDVLTNDLVKVSGFSANEKDADLTTETDEHEGKSWTWSFAKPHDIRTVELWGYGYSARSAFGIASVQYKRKGDEGWTKVVGSALELFNYYTNGHCAQLRGEKKWLLRDVTDLKLVLGEANNGYVLTAEVFCTGARSVHGLMMIVK